MEVELEWFSLSGSERQRRDVVEMLVVNIDTLDRDYLERWATELGLAPSLAKLWSDAERELGAS